MGIKKILAVKMGKIENDKVLTKKTRKTYDLDYIE